MHNQHMKQFIRRVKSTEHFAEYDVDNGNDNNNDNG